MARLKNKDKANADFAKVYERAFKKHRRELERLLGTPPNLANVPEDFWQRIRQEIEEESAVMIYLLFLASATQDHDRIAPGLTVEVAEPLATDFARQRAQTLAGQFIDASRKKLGKFDGSGIVDGQEVTREAVKDATETVFGESRAERMGVTEATEAATKGGDTWKRETEQREGRRIIAYWAHSGYRPRGHANATVDPCTICSPLEGRKLDDLPPQFQTGPPGHPICDCFIKYRFEDVQRTNPDKQEEGYI